MRLKQYKMHTRLMLWFSLEKPGGGNEKEKSDGEERYLKEVERVVRDAE
jgi:hypothetical protein